MSDSVDEAYFENDSYIPLHTGEDSSKYLNALNPPVFLTSLHTFDNMADYQHNPNGAFVYGRYGNPNEKIVEEKIAALEHGKRAFLYPSGMGAASAAIMAVCKAGSHVVCVHNAYGCVGTFLEEYCKPDLNMDVTFVHGWSTDEIRDAIRDNTALIILESPGTATFSLVDLEAVSKIAKEKGIVTYIDNTYCSPIFQKPLTMGIDIVMHSATKYLGGHSDILGGVLVTSDDRLIERLKTLKTLFGGIMGPMEAWLLMRGLRTLPVRMKAHEAIALKVAQELEKDPHVKKVYYPGLPSHPQYELVKKQQSGSSGLLSFELNATTEEAVKVVEHMKVFKLGPSWGGFESLIVMPLWGKTDEYAAWYGASRGLIRIHCGLEGADVLLADLKQAFALLDE